MDEPLVWYEGAGTSDRRWLIADRQGSVIAAVNSSGALIGAAYAYGPYGEPDASNGWSGARFRYTGQIALPELRLYHYRQGSMIRRSGVSCRRIRSGTTIA